MKNEVKILDKDEISQKILRLSWEIYENNFEENEIFLFGIGKKGYLIAKKIRENLISISKIKVHVCQISFNREKPYEDISLSISSDKFANKSLILVDDVLYSGKTLMYSSKVFLNTPIKKISVLALIDRNHNTYPIKADYKGLSLSTNLKEYIRVELSGRNQGVYLS
tara:strand:- start:784 stop:1284 length:501 start_codon:yes stop_codon:yes gene_type:complete